MANRYRGEIDADLGGRRRRLRLTLGALAELEDALGARGLAGLAARLGAGDLAARDAIAILAAGLRGAGETVDDAEVAAMAVDGGAAAYADIVLRLLEATFGAGEGAPANPPPPRT